MLVLGKRVGLAITEDISPTHYLDLLRCLSSSIDIIVGALYLDNRCTIVSDT